MLGQTYTWADASDDGDRFGHCGQMTGKGEETSGGVHVVNEIQEVGADALI